MFRRVGVVTPYEKRKFDESVWDSFKKHGRFVLENRINCIAANYKLPHKYAIPNGRSIIIYKAAKHEKHREIAGFSKSVVTCSYRADGKLIVGGEEGGFLHFCTTDKNTYHLKKFEAHQGGVLHADFLSGGLKAMSLGKDGFAKQWDVALGQIISKYRVGQDNEPPSCMAVGKVDENLFCAGDFNGVVALYDLRQSGPAHKFTLRSTPSALHFACDDQVIVSAANQYVYTWDVATGNPWLQTNLTGGDPSTHPGVYMHYKLVTDMSIVQCPDVHQDPLLLSVGMDRLLRISSLKTFDVFHYERLASPCTAIAVFASLSYVVVGTESGLVRSFSFATPTQLFQNQRKLPDSAVEEEAFSVVPPELRDLAASFSGKFRGVNADKAMTTEEWFRAPAPLASRVAPKDWGFLGSRAPLIHEHTEISRTYSAPKVREPASIARLTGSLLRFQHSRSLSEALRVVGRSTGPLIPETATAAVLAVVRELTRRGTLASAVGGLMSVDIERLLRFIRRNIWHSRATPACLHLLQVVTKVFGPTKLAENDEYKRICLVLDRMSLNIKNVAILAVKMRGILYLDEEVPDSFIAAKRQEVASTPSRKQNNINEHSEERGSIRKQGPKSKKMGRTGKSTEGIVKEGSVSPTRSMVKGTKETEKSPSSSAEERLGSVAPLKSNGEVLIPSTKTKSKRKRSRRRTTTKNAEEPQTNAKEVSEEKLSENEEVNKSAKKRVRKRRRHSRKIQEKTEAVSETSKPVKRPRLSNNSDVDDLVGESPSNDLVSPIKRRGHRKLPD